jgi:ketoreductase
MADRGVAFVSGGSSGIGYGLAAGLLGDGYAVTISARRTDKLAAAAESLSELGEVHHVAANFAAEDDIECAIDSHHERFGRLDVLINNAGLGIVEPIDQLSAKALDRQLDVNLRGYMLCTSRAMAMLRASSRPHIVNVASIAGIHGQSGLSAYSASKAGILGFTHALREELGADGIKATALCPAFVDTPMVDWIADQIGRDRLIKVSDVVQVVLTLLRLSPQCNMPEVVLEPPAGGLPGWPSDPAQRTAATA